MMNTPTLIAAFFGTVAFSIIYNIPRKYFVNCGLIGLVGWIVYALTRRFGGSLGTAIFVATVVVALLSRFSAVWRKCPEIIFLVSGLFPLIPGADIYWTAYYVVAGNSVKAAESGNAAISAALAIVLGMVIIHELPQKVFTVFSLKGN